MSCKVKALLTEAGVTREDPEYGHMFNLTHASIDPNLGVRNGLRENIAAVVRRRYSWQPQVNGDDQWLPNQLQAGTHAD